MSDLDHARELLEMSRGDLNALLGMLKPDDQATKDLFSDEIFGFHAQQAVEKCLKAWLARRSIDYPKRHDLMLLIQLLSDAGENVTDLFELVDLDPFAVQYRYESLASDDEELDRSGLLKQVQKLFNRVEILLQ